VIRHFSKLLFAVILVSFAPAGGAGETLPAGPLQTDVVAFQIGIYYPSTPSADPMATVAALAAKGWPTLTLTKALTKPAGPTLHARSEMNVPANYKVADTAMLGYFGRGLSKADVSALQESKQALILSFFHPSSHTFEGLRTAYSLAEQVARATGGFLWDEETREMFSADKWHAMRLADWTGKLPEVSKSTTIHSYKHGELVRAVSLGMNKFGLPDLVIDQFPWSSGDPMGHMMNIVAQSLVEGAIVGPKGQFDIDPGTIAHAQSRAVFAEMMANGTPAHVTLAVATADKGDPDNRLVEIRFDRYPGANAQERQDAMLHAVFGTKRQIKRVDHDNALKLESARAKQAFGAMQSDFARGLQPGEYILVKAPFATTKGGTEWMWVELISWKGKALEGLLRNEPFDIPAMHKGQTVKVAFDDVFDYLRVYADGRQAGNTTQAIIMKMQGHETTR
jgi:hypothetical protein